MPSAGGATHFESLVCDGLCGLGNDTSGAAAPAPWRAYYSACRKRGTDTVAMQHLGVKLAFAFLGDVEEMPPACAMLHTDDDLIFRPSAYSGNNAAIRAGLTCTYKLLQQEALRDYILGLASDAAAYMLGGGDLDGISAWVLHELSKQNITNLSKKDVQTLENLALSFADALPVIEGAMKINMKPLIDGVCDHNDDVCGTDGHGFSGLLSRRPGARAQLLAGSIMTFGSVVLSRARPVHPRSHTYPTHFHMCSANVPTAALALLTSARLGV